MRVTLLGTGTSSGVPLVGCKCEVCTSRDSRDTRYRSSALIETGTERILIDCGPDFREQMLKEPFGKLDGVLLTHEHYDHVGGIDDLRPFCLAFGQVDIYGEALCVKHLEERLPYCFGKQKYPSAPTIELHAISAFHPLIIGKTEILPFRILHGKMPILGFRIGTFAYITDMKEIPEESRPLLKGIECLVVNGLRHTPHPTHQTIEEAVRFAEELGNPRTYLTHLAHSAGLHAKSETYLPDNVRFGFDGQVIEI